MKKPPEGSLSARTRRAHAAKAVSIGKSAPCEIPPPKHLPQSKTTDWPAQASIAPATWQVINAFVAYGPQRQLGLDRASRRHGGVDAE